MSSVCAVATKQFRLTAITYVSGDRVGFGLAAISLFPVFIVAQLVALVAVRRDWQTYVLLVGIILNVVFNALLKDAIKEPRPGRCDEDTFDSGSVDEYGMPSNHAQFMGFLAMYVALFLFHRVEAPRWELCAWSLLAFSAAQLVCVSRVYLGYHSVEQVSVGMVVGVVAGSAWFGCYAMYLEGLGSRLAQQNWAKRFLLRDTSGIRNVAVFEHAALHGSLHKRPRASCAQDLVWEFRQLSKTMEPEEKAALRRDVLEAVM